jgi:hypothetical protein
MLVRWERDTWMSRACRVVAWWRAIERLRCPLCWAERSRFSLPVGWTDLSFCIKGLDLFLGEVETEGMGVLAWCTYLLRVLRLCYVRVY